jgi:hypothetical protein
LKALGLVGVVVVGVVGVVGVGVGVWVVPSAQEAQA